MISLWITLFCMLILILLSSLLFTNALEYFGEKIGISAGVTGSVFAAIATALPETTVPLLAVLAGGSHKLINQEISVGAILGAPLMLSTLSTLLLALFVVKRRGMQGYIVPERKGYVRDLNFFLLAFSLGGIALFVPHDPLYFRFIISVTLLLLYLVYLTLTLRASKNLVASGHGVMLTEPLIFNRLGFKKSASLMYWQLFFGLCLLLFAAKGFISCVETISIAYQISALLLSLLIIPIATELPEKVNSILWVRKNKDTLGVGNITGALVFQGTLLPALGILLTPWEPSKNVLTGILMTLIAVSWLRLHAAKHGIKVQLLFVNGTLYVIYLWLTFG